MKRGLITLIALFILTPVTAAAESYPLRIWVMHNEIGSHDGPITEARIRDAIAKLREEDHLIIENSVQNLKAPREMKEDLTFAEYIIGDNQLLREIKRFKRETGDTSYAAVEFLRWNDAFDRLSSALSSDDIASAPDVVQIGSTWLAAFADIGFLTDITDYVEQANFFPPSVASSKVADSDRLYAAPWFVDTRLLFYNRRYIHLPEDVADWKSFLATGQRLKESGVPLIAFQGAITWDLLHNLTPWLWAGGGGIIDATSPIGRVTLDAPGSLAGMRYLKKLASMGYAEFPTLTQEATENLFLDGSYATIIAGPWFINRLGPNWQERYGVTLPPAGPSGSVPFVGGSHLAVTAPSKRRGNFDRAIALINRLTSPTAQAAFSKHTGMLPAERHALERYLDAHHAGAFQTALETGRSYPSIPEWGEVIENEMIRTHIWQLWRAIAQSVSDETLARTAHHASRDIRKKVFLAAAARYAPQGGLFLCCLAALGIGSTSWWKRRYRKARRLVEEKTAELKRLSADRAFLEAKALMLEHNRDAQSGELARLRSELQELSARSNRLTEEVRTAQAHRLDRDKKRIGTFALRSDGTLVIGDRVVHFEHDRQARRLLEHLVRNAAQGMTTVHCLWGYPLFGWKPSTLRSRPQRLFATVVAKINGRLKALGKPPLLERVGRGVPAWQFCWDTRAILEHSDVRRSNEASTSAGRQLEARAAAASAKNVITALELDPRNIDALILAASLRPMLTAHDARTAYRLNTLLKIGTALLDREAQSLRHGVRMLRDMIEHDGLPQGIDRTDAEDECNAMVFQADYIEMRIKTLRTDEECSRRSPVIEHVASQVMAVHNELASLPPSGAAAAPAWAAIVDSEPFGKLLAVPSIQRMVNGFHHGETGEHEDPRLVQLALALMLTSEKNTKKIALVDDERELMTLVRQGLNQELKGLEQQLTSGV